MKLLFTYFTSLVRLTLCEICTYFKKNLFSWECSSENFQLCYRIEYWLPVIHASSYLSLNFFISFNVHFTAIWSNLHTEPSSTVAFTRRNVFTTEESLCVVFSQANRSPEPRNILSKKSFTHHMEYSLSSMLPIISLFCLLFPPWLW